MMSLHRFRLPLLPRWALCVLGAGLAAGGCAVNPVTGQREVSLMSPAQEAQAGAQGAKQVEQEIGLVTDPELTAYVQAVGQRLAARSPRKDVTYRFQVADMAEPNAFALPGGYIYVSRGLLALAHDEAELANVLGHEIGHVAARHAAQRQTRATGVGLATVLGTVLAGVYGGGQAAQAASQLGQAAGAGLIASYGRDQERQSDEIGQKLSAESGWDPAAMSSFLASLERETTRLSGGPRRPSYLDSHPALGERVQVTATRAAGLGVVPQAPVARDRAAFLAEIEGMLLGADPAKGACVSGQFVHVDLDFLIRLPTGWRCVNQANAVLAQPAAADAQLRIELQGKGADPAEAARAFAGQNQLQLENGRAERIAGLAAYRAVARANTQQGQLGLDLTWIAHPAGMFRVLGLTSVPKFGSYAADFRAAGGSLRQLKAEERERVTELRLRVVKARAGERLEALSKRSGNAWDLATTAIANKLDPAVSLGAGQLVKIAKAEPYRRK